MGDESKVDRLAFLVRQAELTDEFADLVEAAGEALFVDPHGQVSRRVAAQANMRLVVAAAVEGVSSFSKGPYRLDEKDVGRKRHRSDRLDPPDHRMAAIFSKIAELCGILACPTSPEFVERLQRETLDHTADEQLRKLAAALRREAGFADSSLTDLITADEVAALVGVSRKRIQNALSKWRKGGSKLKAPFRWGEIRPYLVDTWQPKRHLFVEDIREVRDYLARMKS